MSAGPSLYRRHRPRTFADVVGQEHVVRTLRNAVEQGKVHHAYLFVGSRGTGKTSMAKILAACLNCEHGPTIEPCGVCDSCVAIASATSLDVIEMDAASNNSVDDIRDLRESVAYAPVSGRHKVYILDEAHMLSSQAWNAFLKTLEEPPPNTIFVLATTEAQKVLPTVVDRCHRFDFARPTVEQLAAVISRVAGQEDIDIPADAVALLSRHATGSFRDALGTLEQLVTYSGRAVSTDDVLAVLGVADADLLFGALDAVGAHDARGALLAAARLASSGRDLSQVMRDVETHARELLVVQTLGEVPTELHITPDRDARLAEQSSRVGRSDLVRLLELLGDAMRAVKDGAEARTRLELALVEAASPQIDPSARALMARLERLEAALAAGGAPAGSAPTGAAAPAGAQTAPPAPPVAPAETVAPRPAPPARDPDPAGASRAGAPPEDTVVTTAPAASAAQAPAMPAAPASTPAQPVDADADAARTAIAVVAPVAATTVEALAGMWPAVLDSVRGENQLLGVALSEARPVELRDHELIVGFADGDAFNRRIADSAENRAVVEQTVRSLCGRPLRVCFELRELEPDDAEAGAEPPSEDEIVARFVTEFDAQEIVPDPDDQKEGEA
ncbi:MAG: polymerase subunit gamma/tau [Solirubrobacteraceae bacterium]|nr:polymerase subunit gamma/tau [Solirubrobacteraceae bacterium]